MKRSLAEDFLLTAYIILFWFVSGVTLLQGWVNYPTWLDMGPMMSNEDFLILRHEHYGMIYYLAVIPGLLAVALNVALVCIRPFGISHGLLIVMLLLSIGISIATFVVQIPLQDQIDAVGYDREVIQRLIDTDLWTRKIPGLMSMAGAAVVLWQAVSRRAGQA